DGESQSPDHGGREAGRAPQRAYGVAQLRAPAVQVEARAHGGSLFLDGDGCPGRTKPLGEGGAADVERGQQERPESGQPPAREVALAVERGVFDDRGPEVRTEGRGKEP